MAVQGQETSPLHTPARPIGPSPITETTTKSPFFADRTAAPRLNGRGQVSRLLRLGAPRGEPSTSAISALFEQAWQTN